ncbi:condensation domain-containing protein [Puia dinghuensis]|nr:condensation domain-containing protein [Puia dinghuensis]
MKNVSLYVEDDNIVLGNGRDRLSETLLTEIRRHKVELMEFFRRSPAKTQIAQPELQPRREYYELSFMQRNIWVDQKLHPDIQYYNVGSSWSVHGELDLQRLQSSIDNVVKQHEILRTGFRIVDWEPKQLIAGNLPWIWDYRELTGHTEAGLEGIMTEAKNVVFDLESPPLFKIFLIRETEHKHHLIFVIHHIISDGWSLKVFFEQVIQNYRSGIESRAGATTYPLQYKDFVGWQIRQLSETDIKAKKYFWLEKFKDGKGFFLNPSSSSGKQISFSGTTQTFEICPARKKEIYRLCFDLNSTPFIALLAMLKITLYCFTGKDRIVVETGVMDRPQGGLAGQIGPFLSNIPILVQIDETMTLKDFIKLVRTEFICSLAHKEYPIHLIKKDIKLLHQEFNGLTNISFTFHNDGLLSEEEVRVDGLLIVKSDYKIAKVIKGISFHCFDVKDSLTLNVDYSDELFDKQFIDEFADKFLKILDSIGKSSDTTIRELARSVSGTAEMEFSFNFF